MINTRAMLFMTAAMAAFAITDALIKHTAEQIGTMQCLMLISALSLCGFLVALRRNGERFWTRLALGRPMLVRTAGEVFGSAGIVGGLALVPLSTVTALAQAQPLVLTAAAAVFLGERVGWRRWAAVLAGFAGMMIIIRPGREAFDPAMLLPIMGVLGLTARDLGTRLLPDTVSTAFAAAWALFVLTLVGAAGMLLAGGPYPMNAGLWTTVLAAALSISAAYVFITLALRKGEVSAIAPFRYTRIVFAMTIAWIFFGERPDMAVWAGLAVILVSGLYAFWRERQTSAAAPAT